MYIFCGGSEVIDSHVHTENMFVKSTTEIFFDEVQEKTRTVGFTRRRRTFQRNLHTKTQRS